MMVVVSVVPVLVAAFWSIYSVAVAHKADVARSEDAVISQKEAEIVKYITNLKPANLIFSSNATSERALYISEPVCKDARTEVDIEKCVGEGRREIFAEYYNHYASSTIVELSAISLDGRETARIDSGNLNGVPDS
jgi:hypothetical protein